MENTENNLGYFPKSTSAEEPHSHYFHIHAEMSGKIFNKTKSQSTWKVFLEAYLTSITHSHCTDTPRHAVQTRATLCFFSTLISTDSSLNCINLLLFFNVLIVPDQDSQYHNELKLSLHENKLHFCTYAQWCFRIIILCYVNV